MGRNGVGPEVFRVLASTPNSIIENLILSCNFKLMIFSLRDRR